MRNRISHHLGKRRRGRDEGFTLIELLVVLLIIGILLAIAIPVYLSVTGGAKTTAVQSNLTTALTAAKAEYTNSNGNYPTDPSTGAVDNTTLVSDLGGAGTSLTYVATGSSTANTISVDEVSSQEVVLAASDGSNCYAVADQEATTVSASATPAVAGGTWWASEVNPAGGCTASNAASIATADWTTKPSTAPPTS